LPWVLVTGCTTVALPLPYNGGLALALCHLHWPRESFLALQAVKLRLVDAENKFLIFFSSPIRIA
jgi:hypothetical protein